MVRCCASKSDNVRSCISLISCSESLRPCAGPATVLVAVLVVGILVEDDGCDGVEAGGVEADGSVLAAGLVEKDDGGSFSVIGVEAGFTGDEAFVGEGCTLGSDPRTLSSTLAAAALGRSIGLGTSSKLSSESSPSAGPSLSANLSAIAAMASLFFFMESIVSRGIVATGAGPGLGGS